MAYPIVMRELPSQNQPEYRFVLDTTDNINNGMLITPTNSLMQGCRDVYGVGTLDVYNLWITTGVENLYENDKHITDYTNVVGNTFRCERIIEGSVYAISVDGLSLDTVYSDIAAGAYALCDEYGAITVSASANGNLVGNVVSVFIRDGIEYVAIAFHVTVVSGTGTSPVVDTAVADEAVLEG